MVLLQGYAATDALCLAQCTANNWVDGACAVTVWIVQNTVLVANVGDAKAVLARLADKVTVLHLQRSMARTLCNTSV
jgi:serine/threonine protein phosphatase PrpC